MDLNRKKETVFQFRTYHEFLDLLEEMAQNENISKTDIIHKAVLQYKNEEISRSYASSYEVSDEEKQNCEFPRAWENLPKDSIVVYIITNTITKHQYVGSTIHGVNKRLNEHLSLARRGNTTAICRAIRKYKAESFTVDVIPCDASMVRDLEKFYMESLDTLENGYNNAPTHNNYRDSII